MGDPILHRALAAAVPALAVAEAETGDDLLARAAVRLLDRERGGAPRRFPLCDDPPVVWIGFLLVVLPIAEIALLIGLGRHAGWPATGAILLATGLLGALLARHQGLGVLRKVQSEMAAGRVPASQLVDGVILLLAGVLLIIPGVLTDALAFCCLLPAGRALLKTWLRRRFAAGVRSGSISVSLGFRAGSPPIDTLRNVTPRQHSSETKTLGSGDEP
ncbi:MAG TPA: FxsA family protein [Thermoanaerobaculia bacterium]|nr:FxsA family protein [Thermoanaerobaculia bacterium]